MSNLYSFLKNKVDVLKTKFTFLIKYLKFLFKWFIIGLVLTYAVTWGGWLWFSYDVATFSSIKILNTNKTVIAGDPLIYELSYDKKMNIPGILSRKLIHIYKFEYSDVLTDLPVGKGIDGSFIQVPEFAPSGTYYLSYSVAYKVNPLRTITVKIDSEPFEVVNSLKAGPQGIPGIKGEKGDTGKSGKQGVAGEGGGQQERLV